MYCVEISQFESTPLTVSTDWITTNTIVIMSVSREHQNISQHELGVTKVIRFKNVGIDVYSERTAWKGRGTVKET